MTALNKQALRDELEICSKDRMRRLALSLLDEMESADALNKHLELAIRKAEGCSEALRRKTEAAEKRIAELEGLALENIRLKVGISGLIGLGLRYADADVMRLAADAQQSTPTTDGIIENIAAGIGVKGE
ncbi:MAG: ead/Ea22-like family protein [Citrobacter sp.]|uniref:ead/Ea22-like family protein n=1 Tax=Citrobacter sp. TaxID=1896336 RepID=UPI002FC73EB2